jgi:DNA-binding GntR family transcriptional regulator
MNMPDLAAPPAPGSSLHNKVLEQLRNHILSGQVDFGERLAERELCEQFQVSRTPLREALKVLAAEGIVELLPNRGARVRKFTDREIWETFEYLGGLESLAGNLACERITPEEFSTIEQMHYDMYRHFSRRELPEYFAINLRFHHAIVAAARNSVLMNSFQSTSLAMQRLRFSANLDRTRDRWAQAVREHEEMLEALNARNGKELGDIMLRHIRHKSQAVIDWLARQEAESSAA